MLESLIGCGAIHLKSLIGGIAYGIFFQVMTSSCSIPSTKPEEVIIDPFKKIGKMHI